MKKMDWISIKNINWISTKDIDWILTKNMDWISMKNINWISTKDINWISTKDINWILMKDINCRLAVASAIRENGCWFRWTAVGQLQPFQLSSSLQLAPAHVLPYWMPAASISSIIIIKYLSDDLNTLDITLLPITVILLLPFIIILSLLIIIIIIIITHYYYLK